VRDPRNCQIVSTLCALDEARMLRVVSVIRKADIESTKIVDRVILDSDDRRRRRMVLASEMGAEMLLDLERPATLGDGDGLLLDNGSVIQVSGKPECLLEIESTSPRESARLAWHLGNRHTEVQFIGDRTRIRYDHVLEDMLRRLGARITSLEAAFDPEVAVSQHVDRHGHERGHSHHHNGS